MSNNLDALVYNEIMSMYSENPNTYYEEVRDNMFKDMKEDED